MTVAASASQDDCPDVGRFEEHVPVLDFPTELRHIVDTTNAIESPTLDSGGRSVNAVLSLTSEPR